MTIKKGFIWKVEAWCSVLSMAGFNINFIVSQVQRHSISLLILSSILSGFYNHWKNSTAILTAGFRTLYSLANYVPFLTSDVFALFVAHWQNTCKILHFLLEKLWVQMLRSRTEINPCFLLLDYRTHKSSNHVASCSDMFWLIDFFLFIKFCIENTIENFLLHMHVLTRCVTYDIRH